MSTLSFAGGILYIQQNGSSIEYQYDSTSGSWTTMAAWPVTITNTTPDPSTVLTVSFTTDITISDATVGAGTNGYFICGSAFITFDGNEYTVIVDGVADYPGLFRNGDLSNAGYSNTTIQNINFESLNGSTVGFRNGWLCYQGFGNSAFNTFIYNSHNSAPIGPNDQCGFVCGRGFAQGNNLSLNSSSAIVEKCTNSANITRFGGGGIIGPRCGQFGGNVIVRNCSNSGDLNATNNSVAGIVGQQAAQNNGNILIENCFNTGSILCESSAGICGVLAGFNGGIVNIQNCYNTGNLTANYNAGICGERAGANSGTVTINKCYNIGTISLAESGGIAGFHFGYNATNVSITNSYNLGLVQGTSAGGICGSQVGYTDNASITPNVLIQNCYNWGAVSSGAGGLLGGASTSTYAATPIVNVVNCYNNGTIVDPGSSFAATSLQITPSFFNCYAADGAWSEVAAVTALTGYPVMQADNPGSTWTRYLYEYPFILSAFNAENYVPNSLVSYTDVITNASVFTNRNFFVLYHSPGHPTAFGETTGILEIEYNNLPGEYYATVLSYNNAGSYDPSNNNLYGYDISKYYVSFTEVPCFNKGTKILCLNADLEEQYIPIENLKSGDIVKTYKHGFRRIHLIGNGNLVNSPNKFSNCMYRMRKTNENGLIEDLVVTGGHAILTDSLGSHEESNKEYYGENIKIEDKYLFVAANCPDFEKIEDKHIYTYYHFVVQNDGDNDARYGVWANGILTETPSYNQFITHNLEPQI